MACHGWGAARALLAEGHGLSGWLHRLCLVGALASTAASLPIITSRSPTPVALTAPAVAACLVLVVVWLGVALHRQTGPLMVVASVIGLAVAGVALGSPIAALPLFVAATAWATLWVRPAHVVASMVGHMAAYVAAAVSGPLLGMPSWHAGESAVGVAIVLLATPIVRELRSLLEAHDRAARLGRELTSALGALLQPSTPDAVAATVLATARRLLAADVPAPAMAVALRNEDLLEVSATAGDLSGITSGARVPLTGVRAELRDQLERGDAVRTAQLPLDGQPIPADLETVPLLVVPMVARRQLRGVLAVREPSGHDDTVAALATLASQAALALEGMSLTQSLRRSATRFRSLVDHSPDLIAVISSDTSISYASPAAARLLGLLPGQETAPTFASLVHPDDQSAWRGFVEAVSVQRQRRAVQLRLRHRAGHWCHTEITGTDAREEPGVDGIILNVHDVTERQALEDDLRRQASHDPLTGLPNRALFFQQVRAAVANPQRRRIALLFVDLDNFKAVNDRLGHAAGDEVLASLTAGLRSALGPPAMIGRLGGDEFAVVADLPGGRPQAEQLARSLLDVIGKPMTVQRQELRIRASIGVAIGDAGIDDAPDLLRRADLAMYVAKGKGKARFEVFDAATYESIEVRNRLRADLAGAVSAGELEVRYQPIVDLATLEVRHAEALVRWQHPTYGLLGPATFIRLAAEEGLLSELFTVVLRDACLQARSWARNLGTDHPVGVSVNVAPPQLDDPHLVEQVRGALSDVGLDPHLLTLELTENVLVNDPRRAAETMAGLKAIGVSLAIDDFGTGYSSLAYLRRLPVDVLKVDRTFVEGLERPDAGRSLVRTILELSRDLGLRTVAEGVERTAQLDELRRLGCSLGQGYLFSRPLHPPAFRALLAAGPVRLVTPTPDQ